MMHWPGVLQGQCVSSRTTIVLSAPPTGRHTVIVGRLTAKRGTTTKIFASFTKEDVLMKIHPTLGHYQTLNTKKT
ncbi:hypothetical protein Avbf_14682 [Armadillidium vulgare]|nr:hypothetical protein Avbf_14682 [Armadillidium vulgare]